MNVIQFKDLKPNPDIIHTYDESIRKATIVIDNGSYQCRAGWSTQEHPLLIFRNLVAKLRKDRSKKDFTENSLAPQLQVGNDIVNIEAVRGQLRTQFDRNVVTQFETQEHIFDYIFTHLGINGDNCVPHPIVMTEAYLNPNSCRSMMSELLFECYKVPSLSYGVDCLYTYHYLNRRRLKEALIVSLGHHSINIIPVINNCTVFENSRRINIGGSQIVTFLQKILQLKYPNLSTAITLSRIEELLHSVCTVALDYTEELNKWGNAEYFANNVLKVQLPYNVPAAPTITVEQQKERKRELVKRLSEINARKREERLAEDEERLQQLVSIQDIVDVDDSDEIEKVLAQNSLKNIDDLHKTIATLSMQIEKVRGKISTCNNSEEPIAEESSVKKSHKMVFEDEKAQELYLQNAKKMKLEILNKKSTRKIQRNDMAKRRTAAGQERMRIISQLAQKEKGNDDFGMRDEDWDIYKAISREGNDSDSDVENEKLLELDDIIKTYDPQETEKCAVPGASYQIDIGLERNRAPELIFKPYMTGSHEAGLSEVIGYVLSLFNAEDQLKLAANIVLMGGLANLRGLKERVKSDLVPLRPCNSFLKVEIFSNNNLASWYGAKRWAKSAECKKKLVTRKKYEECGYEYLKTHTASNLYEETPKEPPIDVCD